MSKTVKRGSIYWFDPSVYGTTYFYQTSDGKSVHSNVQGACRPWLVVSNNTGNSSSPTCNIVPLTLQEKNRLPVHVPFRMNGKLQIILCEQIRTVDIDALGEYVSDAPPHVQKAVESALRVQFSIGELSVSEHTLEERVKILEQAVKDLQLAQSTKESRQTNSALRNASSQLRTSQIDKFNARLKKTEEIKESEKRDRLSRVSNRWTIEARKQYLRDCETMTPKELMEKYGFKNINSVYQVKYLHKKILSAIGEEV